MVQSEVKLMVSAWREGKKMTVRNREGDGVESEVKLMMMTSTLSMKEEKCGL